VVWLEIYALDRDARRCFASASHLGECLGKPMNTIERVRRELKDDGLLFTAGAGRGATWWPELPARFIPRQRNPTVADVVTVAAELDGWIRIGRQDRLPPNGKGVTGDANPPPQRAHQRASPVMPLPEKRGVTGDAIQAPASSPASIREGGEVGGGDSNLQHCVNNAPSSLRDPEEGGKAEEGARARADGEEGAGASPGTANWREVLRRAGASPAP
jgi:hypothetical protein